MSYRKSNMIIVNTTVFDIFDMVEKIDIPWQSESSGQAQVSFVLSHQSVVSGMVELSVGQVLSIGPLCVHS